MRRFLGGIFGNTVKSDISQRQASGVFDLNGQYYIKQEGGWLPPSPITATGGTKTTPGEGYIYHKFPVSGSFVISSGCLLYTSPSPRDRQKSRMPSSA